MIHPIQKFCRKTIPIILLFILPVILFYGCASNKAAEGLAEENKLITDIIASEDADSTIVTVKSNRMLTYTSIKQDFPLGVLFHFPDTALSNIETVYSPPENDAISSIKVAEIKEDGIPTGTRLFIALKKDIAYDVSPDEGGLNIVFPKTAAAVVQSEPAEIKEETEAAPVIEKPVPVATRLESVSATPLQKNVVINVKADGTIKNYKSFSVDNPPRIVFDMFNLKSPYQKEQRLEVKSKWVKQARHFGHPDKVRLVLDTYKPYLSQFSATPTDSGLLIHVGQKPPVESQAAAAAPAQPPAKDEKQEPPAETAIAYGKPAWVNRIDFSSEAAGKSAVIIGTTRPVKYEIKKVGDKRLHLTLFDTDLPDYRRRALITTRFESAVDRVTPVTLKDPQKDTLFAIELREAVPYYVKQSENIIRVNFEASSIPPKPYEDAQLPAWKKVISEAESGSEAKVATAGTPAGVAGAKEVKLSKPEEELSLEERLAGATSEKKYTGEKIALDFFDTDIKNVFRILREISGKNFAIDKNVTGKVTLTLDKPVPWDQVLDLVLKMNQLGVTMEGDIVRIATLTTLAQEEKLKQAALKAEQAAQKQQEALEPLLTVYLPVNYANAQTEVEPHVKTILTEGRGSISVDARNNQIILTDTAAKIKQAKEIVGKIDQVTPQVIIEARVVEANTDFSRDLGFDWGEVTLGQFSIDGLDVGPTTFTANNLPEDANGALGFNFFKLGGTDFTIIDASLEAAESEGKTNILSAPKIVTLDNKKARIKQGFEVPYLERDSSGNATVRFKDVDLLLEVTPHVTPDNRISMDIYITKNDVVDPTAPEPALSTNEAETQILMDNGDTVVIGGILKSSKSWDESGIPGLRKMPGLGWLFKSQSDEDDKRELLIFLTPQIVRLEQKRL